MTAARIEITLDDAAVQAAFRRLAEFGTDQSRVMADIGEHLRLRADERFEDGRGPDGRPWTPSRRAREQLGQTLIDTARLRLSIAYRAARDAVEVGTNVIYAAIHQFGGTIRAKTSKGLVFKGGRDAEGEPIWRRVQQVTIPARPFLGIERDDPEEIGLILQKHLARLAAESSA